MPNREREGFLSPLDGRRNPSRSLLGKQKFTDVMPHSGSGSGGDSGRGLEDVFESAGELDGTGPDQMAIGKSGMLGAVPQSSGQLQRSSNWPQILSPQGIQIGML